ncbi:hypothetical protein CCL11_12530 [Pseudomonas syringae]|nr:hypothetical protein CCL11_24000 [Pseudomonas syringae]PBP45320.1 hypothetical protein CCL11_12530 [Pseudomonas syringae]
MRAELLASRYGVEPQVGLEQIGQNESFLPSGGNTCPNETGGQVLSSVGDVLKTDRIVASLFLA